MRFFAWLNATAGIVDRIRLIQPLDQLALHGHEVAYDKEPGRRFMEYDTIIGGRVALPNAAGPWTKTCGGMNGPFMVFETDDDYLGTNRLYNPAHTQLSDKDVQFGYLASARVSHRIVTSTDYLANLLQDQTGHPDIVVARNTVPSWMLDIPKPQNERLTIGWAGGNSHRGDWDWWKDGVRRAMTKLPQAKFRFVGMDYRYMLNLPPGRMEHIPWIQDDVRDYWRSSGLGLDIGLALLRPELFNRSKSEIKLIEYAARGIPAVATDYGVYSSFLRHGETGFLVKDKKQLIAAILELANDPELRADMGAQARLQAREHTIEARWKEYEEAYTP